MKYLYISNQIENKSTDAINEVEKDILVVKTSRKSDRPLHLAFQKIPIFFYICKQS